MDKYNPEGVEGEIVNVSPSTNILKREKIICINNNCPINTECKIYMINNIEVLSEDTLKVNYFQPISLFKNFNYKENGCQKFIQINEQ